MNVYFTSFLNGNAHIRILRFHFDIRQFGGPTTRKHHEVCLVWVTITVELSAFAIISKTSQ